jgi:hypothetical protein
MACGSEPAPDEPVPETLRLTGAAAAETAEGDTVDCDLYLDITGAAVVDGEGTGDGAGEVFRRVVRDDLPLEFSALVAGPVTWTIDGDAVVVRAFGDQPDDAQPFWLAIEAIEGVERGPGEYEGSWSCAPILDDLDVEAEGSWEIGPPAD